MQTGRQTICQHTMYTMYIINIYPYPWTQWLLWRFVKWQIPMRYMYGPPCLSSDIIIILFGPHKGMVVCPWFMFWHSIYISLKYKQFLTFQYIGVKGIIGFRHQIAACEGHSKHRVATYLSICTQYTCHIHQHRAISLFVFYLYYRNIPQCTLVFELWFESISGVLDTFRGL